MLTTIIYRSHICEDVPVKALEAMVAAANSKNRQSNVTGILLFNGTHFFSCLKGQWNTSLPSMSRSAATRATITWWS